MFSCGVQQRVRQVTLVLELTVVPAARFGVHPEQISPTPATTTCAAVAELTEKLTDRRDNPERAEGDLPRFSRGYRGTHELHSYFR